MSRTPKLLNWLKTEIDRDYKEVDIVKNKYINEIKQIKKEDIFKKEEVKYSFWDRIKKILF